AKIFTADAGYALRESMYGALKSRRIDAVRPAKAELIRGSVRLRRFRLVRSKTCCAVPRDKIPLPTWGYGASPLALFEGSRRLSMFANYRGGSVVDCWSEQEGRLYRRHQWRPGFTVSRTLG